MIEEPSLKHILKIKFGMKNNKILPRMKSILNLFINKLPYYN